MSLSDTDVRGPLFISGATALTMDSERRIITDAGVAVEDGRIVAVGKAEDLADAYSSLPRIIEAEGQLLLPGFIDAHVHTSQALLRGCADDLGWRPYLENYIWPIQGQYTPQDALASLRLCLVEMIRSGTTCFVDPMVHQRYVFDPLASAVEESGLRAALACIVMDLPEQVEGVIHEGMTDTETSSLQAASRAVERWHGAAGGRIQVWYGPRVPREPALPCSPEFYRRLGRLAREQETGLTVHLAGEEDDLSFFAENYDATPMTFAQQVGLVGPHVLLAMGCWINEDGVDILAKTGTNLVHCPAANMKMASGIALVPEMRERGVAVALGCDSAANNNAYDMVSELKHASLLHAIAKRDPRALIAEDVLEMATIDGARAIGWSDEIGSIEVDKRADLILVDMERPHWTPTIDPVSNLVYTAQGSDVDTVIVDGRLLMHGKRLLTLDERSILAEARKRGRAVLERADVTVEPEWPVY